MCEKNMRPSFFRHVFCLRGSVGGRSEEADGTSNLLARICEKVAATEECPTKRRCACAPVGLEAGAQRFLVLWA